MPAVTDAVLHWPGLHRLQFRRLDGTMNVAARERAIAEFKENPGVAVLIMSLKAAALGLNLVAANHVILLDLWCGPILPPCSPMPMRRSLLNALCSKHK